MIAKLIHIITGPSASSLITTCINSWNALKVEGFEVRIWKDPDIIVFIEKYYPFALEAIVNGRNHAEIADIARYAIVHHFGGYYMDWDVQLLDKEKFLLLVEECPSGYLIQDPINQTIASEAFSAVKGERFLFSLIDNIVDIYTNGFRDSMGTPQYSGPFRMREVFYFTKKETCQKLKKVKEVFLYDYMEIRRRPQRDPNVAMIHYWLHSWIKPISQQGE